MGQIEEFYNEIATNNLCPETELCMISDLLFVVEDSVFVNRRVLLGGVLFVMLSVCLTVVSCLLYDYYKKHRRENRHS